MSNLVFHVFLYITRHDHFFCEYICGLQECEFIFIEPRIVRKFLTKGKVLIYFWSTVSTEYSCTINFIYNGFLLCYFKYYLHLSQLLFHRMHINSIRVNLPFYKSLKMRCGIDEGGRVHSEGKILNSRQCVTYFIHE